MRLLTFRVELLPGLELRWHDGKVPCLAFALRDSERSLLRSAGGPERWDRLELPLLYVLDRLEAGASAHPDARFDLARTSDDRVLLTLFYGRAPIVEREVAVKTLREADRIAERIPGSAAELMPGAADPERAAWAAVWAEEKAPIPVTPIVQAPIPAPPIAVEPPPAAAPAPPVKAPGPPVRTRPPAGPLKIGQVRLFAQSLREQGRLPDSLSEAARDQVLAFAAS